MESGAVIEGLEVIEDGGAGLGAGGEAMMIDQFVFKTAKERFDEGVIVAIGFACRLRVWRCGWFGRPKANRCARSANFSAAWIMQR